MSRISLVNTLARLASSAFLRPSMDGPLPMTRPALEWSEQAGDFTRLLVLEPRIAHRAETAPPAPPRRAKIPGRCGSPAACNARQAPAIAFPPRSRCHRAGVARSEEHTSELQSLMRSSYAVFCLKKKNSKQLS